MPGTATAVTTTTAIVTSTTTPAANIDHCSAYDRYGCHNYYDL